MGRGSNKFNFHSLVRYQPDINIIVCQKFSPIFITCLIHGLGLQYFIINQTFIFYQSKFKMLQGRILTYPPYIKALDPDTSTTNFTYNMEGNDCCQLKA